MKVQRECEQCGIQFWTESSYVARGQGRFCSHSCSATFFNALRPIRTIPVPCSTCGKTLNRKPSQLKKDVYCNRERKRLNESKGRQRARSNKKRSHLLHKDELIAKIGISCQVVGCTLDLMGDRRLVDMHHWDDPQDHSNTSLLCPYHHRLADLKYLTSL